MWLCQSLDCQGVAVPALVECGCASSVLLQSKYPVHVRLVVLEVVVLSLSRVVGRRELTHVSLHHR